ncbi:MAG: hypothetical protein ACRECY_20090, partial [Phyllobacterium sp.]
HCTLRPPKTIRLQSGVAIYGQRKLNDDASGAFVNNHYRINRVSNTAVPNADKRLLLTNYYFSAPYAPPLSHRTTTKKLKFLTFLH